MTSFSTFARTVSLVALSSFSCTVAGDNVTNVAATAEISNVLATSTVASETVAGDNVTNVAATAETSNVLATSTVASEIRVPSPTTQASTSTKTTHTRPNVLGTTTAKDFPAPFTEPAPKDIDYKDNEENLPAPGPEPSPSPQPGADLINPADLVRPAPETTIAYCAPDCRGQTCEYYLSAYPDMTCGILRDAYSCDCTGCSCENTYEYSCLNQCGKSFSSCSCTENCDDTGDCCSDYTAMCSGFDFSSVEDLSDETTDDLALVVIVGAVLLVVGAVGGFFVTRQVLINQRIARENKLLAMNNANIDSYTSPNLQNGEQFGML